MAPPFQPVNPGIRFFHPDAIEPVTYAFAIMVSRFQNQWIWVKHKERSTWELPAGHIEPGETPLEAARRELFEETGALDFILDPVIAYEGIYKGKQVFGMIFLARVLEMGPLPGFEIGEVAYFDGIPDHLTYPAIQPSFFNYIHQAFDGQADAPHRSGRSV